ncbi:MAG: coproporphyrinogen dehydrogenase HemZ [Clostridia bacterium]|nr:coproporphyrinogen dehydrogenase HemZ [Clostridia bacterium]
MILKIDGNLKPYYAQTLCMIFFPGVKFPEGEMPGAGVPEARFTVREDETGADASATLILDEKNETRASRCDIGDGIDAVRARQIAAGCAFYEAASALIGIRPPWGVLTGVRPAKIASEMFRCGYSSDAAAAWISEHYLTDPVKAHLAASVAEAEHRLITPDLVRKCSVYIAIPFCPTRCAYCSFVSYTSKKLLSLIPDYLIALRENIRTVFNTVRRRGLTVSTVYIGGGTPTVLTEDQLRFLLETVAGETDVSALSEFTLEAGRPDTITEEKLRIAKEFGVTRISVNPQTLNDAILASVGRQHTAAQFFAAYDAARAVGIRHINVDLIAGLPGESTESFVSTVDRITALRPDNITVHTFTVKKSAEIRQENESVYDREGLTAGASVAYSQKAVTEAGYLPYYMYRQKNTVGNLENVGYALPGAEGLYNIYMMEEVHSIFAAGASAVTKFVSPPFEDGSCRIDRIFESKYPYEYLKDYEGEAGATRAARFDAAAESFYKTYF